jgi:hypothetical protein
MELRDRLARAEQDIKNHKETFHNFKNDDFASLKADVHQMRRELNEKVDDLIEKVSSINLTMAKSAGAFSVLLLVGQLTMKYFLG